MLTNSDLLVKEIINNGVTKLFCVPGGGCMIMQDAAIRSNVLNPICFHSEQAAVLAAEFYGRNSNCGIGIAMVTTGPGATNTVSSVTSAWLDSRPLIVILGQVKSVDLNKNNNKIRAYGVQYVDTKSIFKGISKEFIRLKDSDDITFQVKKAFNVAKSGRPGPVIIEVPLDLQSKKPFTKKNHNISIELKKIIKNKFLEKINKKIIEKIFNKFIKSKRPIILIGSGCVVDRVTQQTIRDLISLLQVPIANSWGSLDLIEDNNPFYIGAPGTVGKRTANICVKNCDFILAIGNRIDLATTAYSPEKFGSQVKDFFVVDIDIHELRIHKKLKRKIVNSGAKNFISEFSEYSKINIEKIEKNRFRKNEWIQFCKRIKLKFSEESYTKYISNIASKGGWSTYEIIEQFSNLFAKNTHIVTGSSGHSTELFYAYFRVKFNQRIFNSPSLGSMGFGLGSAIGLALSDSIKPKMRVILIETDGSFNTNPQELGIISNLKLPIDIYILNNNGYLSIKNGQSKSFEGRYSGVNADSGLGCANLENLSKAYNIRFSKAIKRDDLDEIIKLNAKKDNIGPSLTEILTSTSEELLPKCMPQKDDKGNIKSMPMEDMTPLLSLKDLQEVMKYQQISQESFLIRN